MSNAPLFPEDPGAFVMRKPCPACGDEHGRIKPTGAQDCVYCVGCGKFQYNAPRTETGRAVRSVTTVHNGIKPKQRARVLARAGGTCELCHSDTKNLHVGHMLSVNDGLTQGLSDSEINADENLMALCDECNLGLGKETISLRLALGILWARMRRQKDSEE